MKIILILLFVCEQPDTVIVKYPNSTAKYTHKLHSNKVMKELDTILKEHPIIITYQDDRGLCT